ncbi:MAG: SDR family oxidoreductase [Sphingobacteriales bacterium]|nr:MAG: SDR family oxidoreductase [Sphingobacteriales bacterium]
MKKKVLITGGNKGIGFETAKQLLAKDYFVYIGCRDEDKAKGAIDELNSLGFYDVKAIRLDVSSNESIKNAAGQIESLDVLINNAGIPGAFPQNASETSPENIRNVFDTNFFGLIETTQAFIPMLKKSETPIVVNVSSDLGSLGYHSNPDWEHYDVKLLAYCSSKTALNAFTVMLAYEFRNTNFKINSVNPGYTKTDFNNNQGPKSVEDAGALIVQYATLDNNGPTGKFFSEGGESPW